METVVLAFDIERTGAKPEHETIAIGISVVNENFKQLDSWLIVGYIPRPIPEDGTAPEGFEVSPWEEFWCDKQEHLEKLSIVPYPQQKPQQKTQQETQQKMIIQFQEFRKKWEYRASVEGFKLEVCCDNPVYDGWFINEMLCQYLPEYHPLPYASRQISYQPLWDTDSMLRGLLATADPTYKNNWGLSNRVREIYDVETEDIDHDAYNIACDAQIVLGVRDCRIHRRPTSYGFEEIMSTIMLGFNKIIRWFY